MAIFVAILRKVCVKVENPCPALCTIAFLLQSALSCLEAGMQDSLKETVNKTLKKLAGQQQHGGKEDIDDTFLT